MEWTCYAHPPSKNGKPCLHENVEGIDNSAAPKFQPIRGLLCCEECGCTKIASDLRRTKIGTAIPEGD